MVTGIEGMIVALRESGFPLILLWMLTLAIVYGILSHVKMPQSSSARAVISLVTSFMVLFAAAATMVTAFIQTAVTSFIVIVFALIILMIFLELSGAKKEGANIFAMHPKFFGVAMIIVVILIFLGAGGFRFLPAISIPGTAGTILLFLGIMVLALWILMKEEKK